jgi:hypothetical protein
MTDRDGRALANDRHDLYLIEVYIGVVGFVLFGSYCLAFVFANFGLGVVPFSGATGAVVSGILFCCSCYAVIVGLRGLRRYKGRPLV